VARHGLGRMWPASVRSASRRESSASRDGRRSGWLALRRCGRKGARFEHRLGHESAVGNRYAVNSACSLAASASIWGMRRAASASMSRSMRAVSASTSRRIRGSSAAGLERGDGRLVDGPGGSGFLDESRRYSTTPPTTGTSKINHAMPRNVIVIGARHCASQQLLEVQERRLLPGEGKPDYACTPTARCAAVLHKRRAGLTKDRINRVFRPWECRNRGSGSRAEGPRAPEPVDEP
jgi:hypothetical protein